MSIRGSAPHTHPDTRPTPAPHTTHSHTRHPIHTHPNPAPFLPQSCPPARIRAHARERKYNPEVVALRSRRNPPFELCEEPHLAATPPSFLHRTHFVLQIVPGNKLAHSLPTPTPPHATHVSHRDHPTQNPPRPAHPTSHTHTHANNTRPPLSRPFPPNPSSKSACRPSRERDLHAISTRSPAQSPCELGEVRQLPLHTSRNDMHAIHICWVV